MKRRILAAFMAVTLATGILSAASVKENTASAEETEKDAYILSYTRENDDSVKGRSGGLNGMYQSATTDSMHLAYSSDGINFEPLNNNTGVLFAKNDGDATKVIRQPYIFRMKDGTFGVIAVRANEGEDMPDKKGTVLFFKSEDLLSYEEVKVLELGGDDYVTDPSCEYDEASDSYSIKWTGMDTGTSYENKTKDFATVGASSECNYKKAECPKTDITYAIESNVIKVSAKEAKKIYNKLSTVTNTTIDPLTVNTEVGTKVDLSDMKVTAEYSDGSKAEKCVTWNEDDIKKVDFSKVGSYTVRGDIRQLSDKISDTGNYPFIPGRADPNAVLYNGRYYFIATNESGNVNLYIRESDTVAGLNDSKEYLVYDEAKGAEGNIVSKANHWAPELHIVDNELYMFFSSNIGDGWDVQSCIMKLKTGGDPKNYDDWEAPARFLDKNGKVLNTYYGGITLDMTHFSYNDRHYVVWAQRNFGKNAGTSDLWIGEVTPDNPGQLISDQVKIVKCEYSWERNHQNVTEGPNVIIRDDKLYLTYSGGATDETYCVGMTQIQLGSDVNFLNADSWKKTNYPLLTGLSSHGDKAYHGPGHNSYVVDEDGYMINVFHARPGDGSQFARDAFLRIVHFGADGEPVLDMEDEQEILPENKAVTMTVNVNKKNESNNGTTNGSSGGSQGNNTVQATAAPSGNSGTNSNTNTDADKGSAVTRFVVGKMTYKVTSGAAGSKTVELVKNNNKKASKAVIPKTVKYKGVSYKVTSVSSKAFYKNVKLKKLIIGKNVTVIKDKAFFGCKNLKSITINAVNLKKAGRNAFKGISKKAVIKVPEKKKKSYSKILKKAVS